MIELNKCNRLLDEGFSLITVRENKIPNTSWKEYQNTAITKDTFAKHYALDTTDNVGIVTGYADLECIDVDLKVFSTAKEQKFFWDEYLNFLQDNIFDFDDKFVIYKTKNAGFHLLYKSKRVEGNLKIAKLKGHNQCVIETRGVGGYVFTYDGKNLSKKTYKDIQYISDEDRSILMSISNTYNYKKEIPEINIDKKVYNVESNNLTSWDDYNNKTNLFDLISSEFTIVRNLKDKYIIKRHGSASPHSGYIYKDKDIMFLYSTGTSFDAEKAYSAFSVYTHLRHHNDFSEAAKQLYKDGYGDRIKPKKQFKDIEPVEVKSYNDTFPIEILPLELQQYILVCNQTLNNSIDYMACSLLFLTSIIIGNSMQIEVKKGWKESANIWLALVGRAGIGKTPSISSMTFPLEKINNREIKKYILEFEKFEAYNLLDKKERALVEEIKQPKKNQFIANDITLEALLELHGENANGVGILKDELAGFFKDMNKYRAGSDLEHWLSSWSNKQINLNRKTAKSSFVERAFLPILGGIQPTIMDEFYSDENKDNGFIDRILFCYPEMEVEEYSERDMKDEQIEWYSNYIISFYERTKKLIKKNDNDEIEPILAKMSDNARAEWIRIFNEITSVQNGDLENEYMKSMLPKQKAYIPRFALILNTLESIENKDVRSDLITAESVLKAEVLSKYFINMAKKIKIKSIDRSKMKSVLDKNADNYINFKNVYLQNKSAQTKEIAEMIGVSNRQVQRYKTKYDKEYV
jgi:hypothetical protein